MLLYVGPDAAVADHSYSQCIIHVSGEMYPVVFRGEPRQNPDSTFYPGDAFYYLFRWEERSDPLPETEHTCGLRADFFQQSKILHIARAYLKHVSNLGNFLDIVRIHHFGNDA